MAPEDEIPSPSDSSETRFETEIGKKEERKIKARRDPDQSIWFGFGMMGLVGWSVSIPTLIGVAIGVWIDTQVQTRHSWTLMCLLIGVALGCLNAWFWIKRHGNKNRK